MSQRITKIEAWALNIIERVKAGGSVEDARVELKREWPSDQKAARRIAAHANASFGSDVLWIIGVDEAEGVSGAKYHELATWWPSVARHFDGISPAFTDIALSIEGKTVVCLLFDTNRPPYVVKNPAFGSPGGGAVSLEIPWREGTSVRTATRNDLVRMLVPTALQPDIEFLSGSGNLAIKTPNTYDSDEGIRVMFHINIYLLPRSDATLVIPFHKCQCILSSIGGGDAIEDFSFTMHRPSFLTRDGGVPDSVTIERTSNELIAHGPGKCTINASILLKDEPGFIRGSGLSLRIVLFIVNAELPIELIMALRPVEESGEHIIWKLASSD